MEAVASTNPSDLGPKVLLGLCHLDLISFLLSLSYRLLCLFQLFLQSPYLLFNQSKLVFSLAQLLALALALPLSPLQSCLGTLLVSVFLDQFGVKVLDFLLGQCKCLGGSYTNQLVDLQICDTKQILML